MFGRLHPGRGTEAIVTAPPFIHLRVHSEYSLIDGLVRVKPLVARCEALAMPAVGL
ncbi:MAG: PHP domain-containing protein, partial [Pseudomonadales bacterium]